MNADACLVQQCLGSNPYSSCYLVSFKNCRVLLDCGIDFSSFLTFAPAADSTIARDQPFANICGLPYLTGGLKIHIPDFGFLDFAHDVDVVLISNYLNMGALPYITEYLGFQGRIYATTPTAQIGREMLLELVEHAMSMGCETGAQWTNKPAKVSQHAKEFLTSLHPDFMMRFPDLAKWCDVYSRKEVESCFKKIRTCSFGQPIQLFDSVKTTAVSSGYCLGSANWVLETATEKVAYVAQSTSSTTVSMFNQSMKMNEEYLKNCDALILSEQALAPPHHEAFAAAAYKLCEELGTHLRAGKNVIIPVNSGGLVMDLLSIFHSFWTHNHLSFPIFSVGTASQSIGSISQISAEWLNDASQERTWRMPPQGPTEPLPHEDLIRDGVLQRFSSVHDPQFAASFRSPCVVLARQPTLRCGDAQYLVHLWKNSDNAALILVEPEIDVPLLMHPFGQPRLAVSTIPLDSRLSFTALPAFLAELKPAKLFIHRSVQLNVLDGSQIPLESIIVYSCLDSFKINFHRKFEAAKMSAEVAKKIVPRLIGSRGIAQVKTHVVARDGQYSLTIARSAGMVPVFYGQITLDRLMNALVLELGYDDAKITHQDTVANTVHIDIPSLNGQLQLAPSRTNIRVYEETHRKKIAAKLVDMLKL